MANRNKGRRARSRKRRPAPAGLAAEASAVGPAQAQTPARAGPTSPSAGSRPPPPQSAGRGGAGFRDPLSLGERPQPPWHPLPLSELLILVGAIGTIVGLHKGASHGAAPLFAGLAAVLLGTVEVTLREHLSGYRSHTVILTVLAVIAFHSVVVLSVAALTSLPLALNVALLVLDAALFRFLYRLLRARFADARRERTFARRP